nr:secreted RxLR effector protein 161-like [Lolium perenne]
MEERLKLSRESTAKEVDATKYRQIVGSLRYLVHTRPDLAFAIGFVSRFMERPTKEHMMAVKRILRYVAGTTHYGLHYQRKTKDAHLIGYSDSNLAGDIDTRKSTSGNLFFLGNCLQLKVFGWLDFLENFKEEKPRQLELMVDNKSAPALAKNPALP